jgi:ketosteroid isomerase-like protein
MSETGANPAAAVAARSPSSAAADPGDLHRQWILEGWERRESDRRFVFADKLGRFYSNGSDLHLYDDYDPQHRVARTAADYGGFWEGPFNNLRSARHAVTDGPDVLVGSELAATTLEFVARLESANGKVNSIRARSSLVWRREEDGWRIVREQNSVREVPPTEVQTALEKELQS